MGAYSVQFYGIDLSEHYDTIAQRFYLATCADRLPAGFDVSDYDSEGYDAFEEAYPDVFRSFLETGHIGATLYDGGGYGQIAYIGVRPQRGKRGVTVSDEAADKVDAIILNLPEHLRKTIADVYGKMPEAEFHTVEGWG